MRITKRIALPILFSLIAVLAASVPASASVSPPSARRGVVHVVRPGESIQAALHSARPGDTVLVKRGVYHEAVEITTDDVTLVGQGAVLEPAANSQPLGCDTIVSQPANAFGLCITGSFIPGLPPTLLRPVKNVTVRGMIVHRFDSTGILALGAANVRIEDSQATGGVDYGILVSQTARAILARNTVTGGDEAGIYIGDSHNSHVVISHNFVFNSGIFAVFLRDSSVGTVISNKITTSCIGVAAISTTPAANDVAEWLITHNRISDNTATCPPPDEGGPGGGGTGVLLSGTSRIVVSGNTITGNGPSPGTNPPWSGGLVLTSGTPFGGLPVPTGNLVIGNVLHGNQPFDLNVIDQGSNNYFVANRCQTSSPAGLCNSNH